MVAERIVVILECTKHVNATTLNGAVRPKPMRLSEILFYSFFVCFATLPQRLVCLYSFYNNTGFIKTVFLKS